MPSRPPKDQRGFSLIVVFLIIIVMAAVAAGVMTSTQGDLQVSGYDREAAVAFYTAEAGVAYAQRTLAQRVDTSNPRAVWTSMLSAAWPEACAPSGNPRVPGVSPSVGQAPVAFDIARSAYYTWCFHNNALDAAYASGTGDLIDSDNVIVIESVGVTGADGRAYSMGTVASRLSVEIRYTTGDLRNGSDCAQRGGCDAAQRNTGDAPTNGSISTRVVTR